MLYFTEDNYFCPLINVEYTLITAIFSCEYFIQLSDELHTKKCRFRSFVIKDISLTSQVERYCHSVIFRCRYKALISTLTKVCFVNEKPNSFSAVSQCHYAWPILILQSCPA